MALVLQDVRKAYRLIADYQQRVVELLDFIKKELNAEHYWQHLENSYSSSSSIKNIYTDQKAGKNLLPMLDMHLLWYRENNTLKEYNTIQNCDLFFDILLRSDNNKENSLSVTESTSELQIFIYQNIKFVGKDWYNEVWLKSEYPKFNTVQHTVVSPDIEYKIYGEKIDLTELFNETATRNSLAKFRKRASEKLVTQV